MTPRISHPVNSTTASIPTHPQRFWCGLVGPPSAPSPSHPAIELQPIMQPRCYWTLPVRTQVAATQHTERVVVAKLERRRREKTCHESPHDRNVCTQLRQVSKEIEAEDRLKEEEKRRVAVPRHQSTKPIPSVSALPRRSAAAVDSSFVIALPRRSRNNKVYNVTNPFDFMDMIFLQGKTNFFEKRVSDHSKANVTSPTQRWKQQQARLSR
ncbi:hypothetical protein BS17DRAFT_768138 [Gyrodon lividus]|nr:hypothetical protein BS17DRAFT_768138 [Gyrodon lividus]